MPGRSMTSWLCIAALLIGGVLPAAGTPSREPASPGSPTKTTSSADTASRAWVFVLELDTDPEPDTSPLMHGPAPGLFAFALPTSYRPSVSGDAFRNDPVLESLSHATLLHGLCRLTV